MVRVLIVSRGASPLHNFILEDWSESNYSVVHVADEVVPVWITINETCSINVKLKNSLKCSIYFLKIIWISLNLHNIKTFFLKQLILRFILPIQGRFSNNALLALVLIYRYIFFNCRNQFTRQLEIALLLLLYKLDEVLSICE